MGCGRASRVPPRVSWRLAQGTPGVSPFTRGSAVPSCNRGARTSRGRASPPSNNKLSRWLFTSWLAVEVEKSLGRRGLTAEPRQDSFDAGLHESIGRLGADAEFDAGGAPEIK